MSPLPGDRARPATRRRRRSRPPPGWKIRAFQADVTDAADVTRLATEVIAECGTIDILVNNAGTNIRGKIAELSEADWDTVIDTNLKGPFLCSRAIGPLMVARGWGRVINLGLILSVIAIPGRAPYASSKAGIVGLTKVLALEWAGTGVTCNAICPGPLRHRHEPPAAERPGRLSAVHQPDSARPLGRARRDGGPGGVPRWMPRRLLPAVHCSWTAAGRRDNRAAKGVIWEK